MGLRKLKEYRKAPQMRILKYEAEEKTKFPPWMIVVLMIALIGGISFFVNQSENADDETLEEFVEKAKENKSEKRYYQLAKIPYELVEQLNEITDKDLKGFSFSITTDAIRHIEKKHNEENERVKGQKGITLQDYSIIADILLHPDFISNEENAKNGAQTLRFTKSNHTIITQVFTKKKTISVVTYYIKTSKP